ncbi:MAG: ATP-binding protein [Firmicutes bacterium]|nr:ATP-binding protein [Bacillota bacterium]
MVSDVQRDFLLEILVDYALLNDIIAAPFVKLCLHKIGIKQSLIIEQRYRDGFGWQGKLQAKDFTNLILYFLRDVGGHYSGILENDKKKLELTSICCPFKQIIVKYPALCQIISSIIGSIAARNFDYCKVSVSSSCTGMSQACVMIVHLEENEEAEQAEGTIFTDEPFAYLLTTNDIKQARQNITNEDHCVVNGLEELKTEYREMDNEYNQLRNEIFSDLKLGVIFVDATNQITYINSTAQEALPGDGHWDSAMGQKLKVILADTVQNGKRYIQHIIQLGCADAAQYYSINASPLLSKDGRINGAVGVLQEVTEFKLGQDELLQLEKFSLVAELAAGTAHEIRNPMTTLRGFLQLLSQEFSPEMKGHEYCSLMINEIDRANYIIKEFLLLTKPAAPSLKKVNVHIILEEIFLLIESKSLLENVKLRKRYAEQLPLVQADPAQIKQVFLNIATNAIQAMPIGGQLTISTMARDCKAIIQFTDTGCGMDEKQLTRIFHPFYTSKESGTGLGLTISFRIIESHGGRIYVESSLGKGTTFTIEIPAFDARNG